MISTTPGLDRSALIDWYRRNRERSAQLFALIDDDAFFVRPIPLRHPFIFYEGHLPAFSFLTLNERALGQAPIDPVYERLFERGIDPGSSDAARAHERGDWPSRAQVEAFARVCDERVVDALARATLVVPDVPKLRRGQSTYTILEHEPMHHETLTYIIHQLDYAHKGRIAQEHHDHAPVPNPLQSVAAGTAHLGADPDAIPFGWDNEFGPIAIDVPRFAMQRYPVTNGDWLRFVEAGGPVPVFWVERDGEFVLRGVFEELPLPRSWPVYVSHDHAQAYAEWAGMQLPDRSAVPPRSLRHAGRFRPLLPVGRRPARRDARQLRLRALRSRTSERASRRCERMGNRGPGWKWMGMDLERFRAAFRASNRWLPIRNIPPTSSTASTTS